MRRQPRARMADTAITVEPLLAMEHLLQPVPGPDSSGAPLRNTPVYDQLREALRPPDTAPGGVWQRDAKATDYRAVIRMDGDLLATRSKDLDIAVWLTEALAREQRIAGLSAGIHLIQRLLEVFWDTLHPRIDEDGD